MPEQLSSTGRGGRGNIGPDDTLYVDAGIVREGPAGQPSNGDYSSGRGGAGNISDTGARSRSGQRQDEEVHPDPALSLAKEQTRFHTGRGGGGNIHKTKYGGHSSAKAQEAAEKNQSKPTVIAEQVKQKIMGSEKKEEDSTSPRKTS